ncbi:LAMI_0H03642g1_1 [Lachancea mirantina]|uniref:LAMI_0H03642g1_1 n=1 Tax=Lachancea mirantina TaxID=1230905 RepID=A0A1G4KEH8_9SACH|nr:LAMI_0H03642g1_1 [Lachancea mirantina]
MDNKNALGRGIDTIQITKAREIHMQTVRSRMPQAVPVPTTQTDSMGPGNTTTNVAPQVGGCHIHRHRANNPNNPPCAHCGAVIIPAPKARFPAEDEPSITIGDWTISTRKKTILNSVEMEQWEEKLRGLALPEMIFGNSFVRVENKAHGFVMEFNALEALKAVKLEDSGIRVSYAHKWISSKKRNREKSADLQDTSLEIGHHYDWTYTTSYKGHFEGPSLKRDDQERIPIDKLSRPDPILFYDDMILFEDELADNGIGVLNVKVRVMNERLLVLSRFFLRVDGVLFRVYDTRLFVEFDENKLIREYKEHEDTYQNVLANKALKHVRDPKAMLRDSNWVASQLPLRKRECEVLQL